MKVTVWVNVGEHSIYQVLSDKEYQKIKKDGIKEYMKDKEAFGNWLSDHYNVLDIWFMGEAERTIAESEWQEVCEELWVWDSAWKPFEIEI